MIVRRLISAAALAAVALAAPLAACGGDKRKSAADASAPSKPVVSLTVGSNAPVYEATTLDSAALKFGGVADSVVLLNVWATWCTSCREEFAELEQLRLTRGPSGVRVVAVSVDQGGSEKVRRFVQAQGTHFPVAHDKDARINTLYGVRGLPTTLVIGRDGTVRWTQTGSFLLDSIGMRKALDAAIAEPARQ